MTAVLLVAALGLGAPETPATPARPASAAVHGPRRSAKAIAAVWFAMLVAGGGLLYRRLGARAQAEEAEALLDEEFARLERIESGEDRDTPRIR
jgi:hypothetical protein